MRNITVEMACSINGLIATEDGNEDFLSYRGWEIMLEFLEEYDVLIWGRKTWENILSWGDDYVKDLKDINIIILSETSNRQNEFSNITYCNSIEDCLKVCENLKYEKLFISLPTDSFFLKFSIVFSMYLGSPFLLQERFLCSSGVPYPHLTLTLTPFFNAFLMASLNSSSLNT